MIDWGTNYSSPYIFYRTFYIAHNDNNFKEDENMAGIKRKEWVSVKRKHQIQVLHSEGYSNARISEITGLPEAVIARILDVTRS